jgi:hypothetical protein
MEAMDRVLAGCERISRSGCKANLHTCVSEFHSHYYNFRYTNYVICIFVCSLITAMASGSTLVLLKSFSLSY